MPGLLVPRRFAAAELNAMFDHQADEHVAEGEHWNRELRRIDEGLSLVWIPPDADMPGVVPGRFHIRKRVPGGLDGYVSLTGPGGSYRAPGVWMLGYLREADMWDERVRGNKARRDREIEEAKRRERVREEEQRQDEMRLATRVARRIRGDSGFTKRTDLKDHKHILEEKARKGRGE